MQSLKSDILNAGDSIACEYLISSPVSSITIIVLDMSSWTVEVQVRY